MESVPIGRPEQILDGSETVRGNDVLVAVIHVHYVVSDPSCTSRCMLVEKSFWIYHQTGDVDWHNVNIFAHVFNLTASSRDRSLQLSWRSS